MPLLSIVIPVYNTDKYLREGLDSILQQELLDIEVICVDDGSTDSSLEILKEYQKKDGRILLVSQIHQGVSIARNLGMQKATGKYITFFDADDLVKPSMYAQMLEKAVSNSLDVIICAYETNLSSDVHYHSFVSNRVVTPKVLLQGCKAWHSSNAFCFSWRMIFCRKLLEQNDIRFNRLISIGEDTLFNMNAILKASRVYYIPTSLYIHRINEDSVMSMKFKPNLETSLNLQILEKQKLIGQNQDILNIDDMYEDILKRYVFMLFNNLKNNPNELDKRQGIIRILKMPMFKDAMKELGFKNVYSSWKEYIFYLAIKFRITSVVYWLYFKNK